MYNSHMLTLSHIYKTYKNKSRLVNALNDINLTFPNNGLVFILGESGAGKSTLLNLITLQDKPSKGKIIIDDIDVNNLTNKDKANIRSSYFGIVFQDYNLIDDFTVYENIKFVLDLQNKSSNKSIVEDMLIKLSLPLDIIDEKVNNLSGGQKQRIAIIRALIKDSRVIVCDEPTGNLDDDNAYQLMDILKNIAKDRLVIVVSHDKTLANKYASRIIKINKGTIIDDTLSNDDNKNINNNNKLAITKSHLSFKNTLLLSLLSFKKVIVRSILSFIALGISLGVFMCVGEILRYDENETIARSLIDNNINYVQIEKIRIKDKVNKYPTSFTEDDLQYINKTFGKNNYLLSFSMERFSLDYLNRQAAIVASDVQLKKFGFDLIGELPINSTQIALTKYDLYKYSDVGKLDLDLTKIDDISYLNSEVINSKIEFSYLAETIEYQISGIVDTKVDIDYIRAGTPTQESNNSFKIRNYVSYTETKLYDVIFISDELKPESPIYNSHFYVPLSQSPFEKCDLLAKYLDEKYSSKISTQYNFFTLENIQVYSEFQLIYGSIGAIAGTIFFVISLLLFLSFTNMSMYQQRKNIKVLKSQGLKFYEIFNIFGFQSLIVTFIATIIGMIIYGVALACYTNLYLIPLDCLIYPYTFNIFVVLIIFIIIALLNLLICYLYSLKYDKRALEK